MSDKKGLHNVDLQNAVKSLKERKVIEQDKEIADKLDMSPGQLSTYLSGSAKMSKNFQKKFETGYNIKLADYSGTPRRVDDVDSFLVTKIKKIEAIAELLLKFKAAENAEKSKRDVAVATIYKLGQKE